MASRWMQAKLAIMARQRKFTPADTHNRRGHSLATSAAHSAELSKLCAAYKGPVIKSLPGRKPEPEGKGKRKYDTTVGARGGVTRQLDLVEWSENARFSLVKRGL